ncbi:hypothetical protein Pta6605_29000 [Pseudomonas amygdali pv. tabaci]|nr:hypothetical protein Pta6605_29000 [Pseudomonas amygdali pv. tabaci]
MLYCGGGSVCTFSEVTHQARLPWLIFASQDQRFLDTWQLAELAFYFTQFNAHATNLHLVVVTAQVLQRAICVPACQVAGAVHARLWLSGERVAQKAFSSQLRLIQVTASDTVAANVQLACHTQRDQLLAVIQQINRGIGDGLADVQAAIGEQAA